MNRFNVNRNVPRSRTRTNHTFETLTAILSQLKQVLNIDDNRVLAFGHSDGADGVFALQLYKPSPFAGFIGYNSMLNILAAYDIYLRNTVNRPLYLVHSDLDDIRPIQQTRLIMKILDSLNSPVLYKEYIGFQHFDNHLQQDLPFSFEWANQISRDPFQKTLTWELSDSTNSGCDWLQVRQIDTNLEGAAWHTELNTISYNKNDKTYTNYPEYDLNKSAAVRAFYNNNTFNISTSRVTELQLLLSPVMVNFQNPVIIKINGTKVFNRKLKTDKQFLLRSFTSSFDRKSLWVTSILLRTEGQRENR
jgi:hypothetical protein